MLEHICNYNEYWKDDSGFQCYETSNYLTLNMYSTYLERYFRLSLFVFYGEEFFQIRFLFSSFQ